MTCSAISIQTGVKGGNGYCWHKNAFQTAGKRLARLHAEIHEKEISVILTVKEKLRQEILYQQYPQAFRNQPGWDPAMDCVRSRRQAVGVADGAWEEATIETDPREPEHMIIRTQQVMNEELDRKERSVIWQWPIAMKLCPAWLVSETDNNPFNIQTRKMLAEFEMLKIPVGEGNVFFPSGNALKYFGRILVMSFGLITRYLSYWV